MKCEHEWRLFGTRLEEEICMPVRAREHFEGALICTKCGVENYGEYEVIGKRPVPHYSGSWDMFKDVLVKVTKWTNYGRTCLGWDEKKKELYPKTEYEWDEKEEQWIKV